jgi:hypothetical protein
MVMLTSPASFCATSRSLALLQVISRQMEHIDVVQGQLGYT